MLMYIVLTFAWLNLLYMVLKIDICDRGLKDCSSILCYFLIVYQNFNKISINIINIRRALRQTMKISKLALCREHYDKQL